MPQLECPHEEQFCNLISQGWTKRDAYASAFSHRNLKPKSISPTVSRLWKHKRIQERLTELGNRVIDTWAFMDEKVTLETVNVALIGLMRAANLKGQFGPAVSAVKLLIEANGIRPMIDQTQHKPLREMSLAEIEAMIGAGFVEAHERAQGRIGQPMACRSKPFAVRGARDAELSSGAGASSDL